MLNLKFANENIDKYKFDYVGYLVIVDKIRTQEVLSNNNYLQLKKHLMFLKEKYHKELRIIQQHENNIMDLNLNKKILKETIVEKIKYIYERLAAIGFIKLGLINEITMESKAIN